MATDAFVTKNLETWERALYSLFDGKPPEYKEWRKIDEIAKTLSALGLPNLTHIFYPSGGGMDLVSADPSKIESGALELHTEGVTELARPTKLSFQSFDFATLHWAYFRLECENMKPSGVYKDVGDNEEVVELTPGKYGPRSAWDDNFYEGEDLPDTARLVTRFVKGAPFVFFAKGSIYNTANGEHDAYDARHAKMDAEGFRRYIKRSADRNP